jgi:hypothetical protein
MKSTTDSSNMLALSPEFHGAYNGLNTVIPGVILTVSSVSEAPEVDDSYKVELVVRALNFEYKLLIFPRLKSSSKMVEGDELAMTTSVLVLDPTVFCTCIEWRSKQILKIWEEHQITDPTDN